MSWGEHFKLDNVDMLLNLELPSNSPIVEFVAEALDHDPYEIGYTEVWDYLDDFLFYKPGDNIRFFQTITSDLNRITLADLHYITYFLLNPLAVTLPELEELVMNCPAVLSIARVALSTQESIRAIRERYIDNFPHDRNEPFPEDVFKVRLRQVIRYCNGSERPIRYVKEG